MKTERVTINEQGRVIIPARIRKQLQLKNNTFVVSVEGNSLRLTPLEETVKNLQALVKECTQTEELSGTDLLFEMRRQEFAKEQALADRYRKKD
jgi:AbrB family looped-hinge helix DNA binding protein